MCLRNRAGLLLTGETRGAFRPRGFPPFMAWGWGSDPHTSHTANSMAKLGPILHVIVQSALGGSRVKRQDRVGVRGWKKKKENHLIANRTGHFLFSILAKGWGKGWLNKEEEGQGMEKRIRSCSFKPL